MGILSFLGSAIKPLTNLIDELHTSDDERGAIQVELKKLENIISIKVLELQKQVIEGQTSIIVAETQSQSWLTRMWRPLMMVMFGTIIAHAYITGGIPPAPIMTTINIGLGGYIGGRSLEGIGKAYLKAKKEDA